jgi:hypothetical protein
MEPMTMMAIGAGVSAIGGLLSKPKDIDPNKVMSMMHSPYQDQMLQRSKDLIDPQSGLMRNQLNMLRGKNTDTTESTWRQVGREFADSDESGIMKAWKDKFANKIIGSTGQEYGNLLANNMQQSTGLLGQVGQMDVNTRTAGASTYAANVTNKNQWSAGIGSGIMNMGSSMVGQGVGAIPLG